VVRLVSLKLLLFLFFFSFITLLNAQQISQAKELKNLSEGNPDFRPEEVIAYEVGYRLYPSARILFDVTGFYHSYDSLITLELGAPGEPSIIGNGMNAVTSGTTLAVELEPKSFLLWLDKTCSSIVIPNLDCRCLLEEK
jgi:outer membrane receptor protein involved in Fe transport